jgi:hypothetical protein
MSHRARPGTQGAAIQASSKAHMRARPQGMVVLTRLDIALCRPVLV